MGSYTSPPANGSIAPSKLVAYNLASGAIFFRFEKMPEGDYSLKASLDHENPDKD
jgi:hypothetical protein